MEVEDQAWVDAVKKDFRTSELTPRRRALCDFAMKLTRTPAAMTRGDLDALREHGLGDADLLDAVQVVSYFNYINRVADALGVPAEDDWLLEDR